MSKNNDRAAAAANSIGGSREADGFKTNIVLFQIYQRRVPQKHLGWSCTQVFTPCTMQNLGSKLKNSFPLLGTGAARAAA